MYKCILHARPEFPTDDGHTDYVTVSRSIGLAFEPRKEFYIRWRSHGSHPGDDPEPVRFAIVMVEYIVDEDLFEVFVVCFGSEKHESRAHALKTWSAWGFYENPALIG